MLLAVTATAIGFAFDAGSGNKELSFVFAAFYALGCVLAVLAVRQTGVFTAVIQPPLILFVAVPTAYFLFHSGQLDGLKDLLINCGYPLIERFPLMFFTSAVVLLIGMARWYYGMSARKPTPKAAAGGAAKTGLIAVVTAKVTALVMRPRSGHDAEKQAPRRRHSARPPARAARLADDPAREARRPAKRAAPSRSRHARAPETEIIEPVADRPRQPRPRRRAEPPAQAEPRRRTRSTQPREPRSQPPVDRHSGYERPDRRRRYDDAYEDRHEDFLPPGGSSSGTHHPISRVRYRSSDDGGGEDRTQQRTTPRRSRHARDAETWEYDG